MGSFLLKFSVNMRGSFKLCGAPNLSDAVLTLLFMRRTYSLSRFCPLRSNASVGLLPHQLLNCSCSAREAADVIRRHNHQPKPGKIRELLVWWERLAHREEGQQARL